MKEIILEGNSFNTLTGFYDEVERKLTKDLDWKIGRNLDAFNDVLRGGFGVFEYGEPIKLIWLNAGKSKEDLGKKETVEYFEGQLKRCHPSNISYVKKDLQEAKEGRGMTLYDIITDLIRKHDHVELRLE